MRLLAVVVSSIVLAACTGAGGGPSDPVGDVVVADPDLEVEVYVRDLVGPTQMIDGPDGRLWVAQLNGPEGAGVGQVVAVDPDSGAREVLVDGLATPTGIAWLDGGLWISTPTALLRADGDPPGAPEVVLDGLPNNGRSAGTLTVTPDGALLFETSGRERDGAAVDRSGVLWRLDPTTPDRPVPLATGFKNAYAHVVGPGGDLWSTEVAEPVGGVRAADELNRVTVGADHGWPACVGDRTPVPAFGGDAATCRSTVAPVALFAPGATPTAVVRSPFDPQDFVVALWNVGRVVTVPADGGAPEAPLLTGIANPQHLLVAGDALLVSDHETGTVLRVHRR